VLLRPRTACINCNSIARIFVVALLAFALLAGMLPSGALSASQACRMACCAGKPPHEAGACNAALPSAEPLTPPSDETQASDEHAAHHDDRQMSVTVDQTATDAHTPSGHCEATKQTASQTQAAPQPQAAQHQATKQSSARPQAEQQQHAARSSAPAEQASFAADVFTKPCSEECAAVAFAFAQLRRPRAAFAHSFALKPRPPTLISRADRFHTLPPSSAAHRRQSSPRGPPISLVNFFA
jgi:hypothetical protein